MLCPVQSYESNTPPATPAYNLVMTAHRIIAAHVLKILTSEYLLLEI